MVNITFYKFKKEDNSTKRPTGGTSFSCQIKRGSGLISPAIELDIGLESAPDYNYCYIPAFNRYYYVREWFFDTGFWTASLTCDVLATYRTEIGSSRLYALRSSAVWDGSIIDRFYPTKVGSSFVETEITTKWDDTTLGYFIVGIVNKNPQFGSISYWAMDQTAFGIFLNNLMDDSLFPDMDSSVSATVQKSIIDPIQYIKSCVYLPFRLYPWVGTYLHTINVFEWDVALGSEAGAYRVSKGYPYHPSTYTEVTIPKHPQTDSRGNFVNTSPYSIHTLAYPPFGVIELDSTVLANASTIRINTWVDLPTGLGTLEVRSNGILLNKIEAQVGVPVSLSQVTRDYIGGVSSILSGIGSVAVGAAAGGPLGILGAVTGGVSAIGNAVEALTPRSQSIGNGGSYCQLYTSAGLYSQFFNLVDDDLAKNGRPCCQIVTPSSNPGYYLIQDGDVEIPGTKEEAEQVRAHLEAGFYWE